jgi:hypothetical protein
MRAGVSGKKYSIEIVSGRDGCETGQSFRDYNEGKDLCEPIWKEVYETENTVNFMHDDDFSPGGCWVDGSDVLGTVVYSNQDTKTYENGVNVQVYCITGVADAGGGDDPCPEPKPTDPAEYINNQCCDC